MPQHIHTDSPRQGSSLPSAHKGTPKSRSRDPDPEARDEPRLGDQLNLFLAEYLPEKLIKKVLTKLGLMSQRVRRLPMIRLIYLLVAGAIFRERSLIEVLECLHLGLPSEDGRYPDKSVITQAMERMGAGPLKVLFKMTAAAWVKADPTPLAWNKFSLYVVDGTTGKVPDSEASRDHFGSHEYPGGVLSSYPQFRLVTLSLLDSRIILDLAYDRYSVGELTLAKTVIKSLPDWSITLFDALYYGAYFQIGLQKSGSNKHYVIPSKSKPSLYFLDGTPGDFRARVKTSSNAKQNYPFLPDTFITRVIPITTQGERRFLLTSLMDRRLFPASEIRDLYRKRWGVETQVLEQKVTMMLTKEILRTRSPRRVAQEIWAAAIAYNIIRLRMAEVSYGSELLPVDYSFTRALNLVRDELLFRHPLLQRTRALDLLSPRWYQFLLKPNVKRPGRKNPRVVKMPAQRYPWRRILSMKGYSK